MPEGDAIRHAARRIGAALVGKPIVSLEAPQPRHRHDRWPERLEERAVRAVESRGKHLFIRFDGDLSLHSHQRMGGRWDVYPRGQRWRHSPHRAWLVIRTSEHEVVQFDGPVLELLSDGRTHFDQRLAGLGPDVLADDLDERLFLRRLREDDPTRAIGGALLDQRNLAGIGNVWKSESCFLAGIDPWRPLRELTDGEALAIVHAARPLMALSARRGGRIATWREKRPGRLNEDGTWVYNRSERPCRRCGTPIRSRGQGEDNRKTFWCPRCQT